MIGLIVPRKPSRLDVQKSSESCGRGDPDVAGKFSRINQINYRRCLSLGNLRFWHGGEVISAAVDVPAFSEP